MYIYITALLISTLVDRLLRQLKTHLKKRNCMTIFSTHCSTESFKPNCTFCRSKKGSKAANVLTGLEHIPDELGQS